jgi:four helix bundle protein
MSKIEKFEDLIAWKKAKLLATAVYKASKQGALAKDFGLSGQMQRAAVSIMSNIAEGFERQRRAEFHHFLFIAKGSCAELRSQLYLAFEIGYIDKSTFESLQTMAEEVGRVVGGLRSAVEKQRDNERGKR